MHSSARGAAALMAFRSFSSAARLSSLTRARYSSIVFGDAGAFDFGGTVCAPFHALRRHYIRSILLRLKTLARIPPPGVGWGSLKRRRCPMDASDFPAPASGFVITHFLVVSDQERSREFYASLLGGTVLIERDPVIMKVANTWLILNEGGGPTDDKPEVTLTTPPDPNRTSAFLNIRVADIDAIYKEWSAKGAEFLTEPKDHGREIRAYVRDPDGHLIEVGQATGI